MRPDGRGVVSISCSPGCAPYLRAELEALGHEVTLARETALEARVTWEQACELCLRLRTAYHVLWRVAEFTARNAEELCCQVSELRWEEAIAPDQYLTVTSVTDTPTIDNDMFVNRKVKDTVVARIQERRGARPDSGPDARGVVLSVFWKRERVWLYLSLSGQKLSDRGYRRRPHLAPMRENLAAAVLMASGWEPDTPLLVPMCGSGTLAIEAALMATGRAPGLLRPEFGHRHLRWFDAEAWERLRARVRREGRSAGAPPILASDLDPEAVAAARANAITAGVDRIVEFQVCDFAATPIPETPGLALLHPEYGERLGEEAALEVTYRRMGDWMKQSLPGWKACVFTGNRDLAGRIGLRPRRRIPFANGELDCRLLCFDLYAGSRRGAGSPES